MNDWMASRLRQSLKKARRKAQADFNAKIAGRAISGSGRPLQESRSLVKKRLWAIISLYVRRRDRGRFAGYCLICATKDALGLLHRPMNPIQCAYHIFPSGDAGVQWDLRNIVGACHACNEGEMFSRHSNSTSRRELYRKIHLALLGPDLYEELHRLSGENVQYSTAELQQMYLDIKQKMEAGV